MLQLLLERGQSYGDLASVLGVGQAEVRSRARAALTELAGTDPDHEVGLADYLLGQADPIGRADVVRHLKDDPADLALATELSQKLLLLAPEAELPRLPGEERRPRPRRPARGGGARTSIPARLRRGPSAAAGPPTEGADGPPSERDPRSKRQTQLIVGVGSGVVLLVAIVLAITGVFSGGGDEGNASTSASGTATGAGGEGFPLSSVKVDKSGNFQDTFAIRKGLQPLLPQTQAVYVTLAKKKVVLNAIKTAVSSRRPVLPVEGKTAFTGVVNLADARQGAIPIPLTAAAGVKGSGAAALGAKGKQAFFQLRLNGVEPPPKDSAYILWFVVG
jgi:hypothetical protein